MSLSSLAHDSLEFATRPNLDYPFGRDWSPEPGVPFEVADGVFWLRVPMPIDLDHINLWLLKDGDGWIIVDSGFDAPQCQAVWQQVFSQFCAPSAVNKIIITHLHPDHTGLASWLAAQCDCPILITHGELELYCRLFASSLSKNKEFEDKELANKELSNASQKNRKTIDYLTKVGFDPTMFERFLGFFVAEDKPPEKRIQAAQCEIIADTDELTINHRRWQVVTGNGHSPEHACLYCAELNLFISGDQALPRISSNVSVYPETQAVNPLQDWLRSCEKLQTQVPDQTLVLPSHQEPFYGLHVRMQQLIYDHHSQLNRLRKALVQPHTAVDLFSVLFHRELKGAQVFFAAGETLAHLHYLVAMQDIQANTRDDGVIEYRMRLAKALNQTN